MFTIISYAPLFKTMKKRTVSQYQLLRMGIDNKTLDGFKKGKNVTLLTVEKLCNILDCKPWEVFEFIEEE